MGECEREGMIKRGRCPVHPSNTNTDEHHVENLLISSYITDTGASKATSCVTEVYKEL